jgi:phosphopantothenoylcysteine decarboxylase / phosphopantothenate---cysteine ligase
VKKVLLGVTGGIAAYKVVELARLFMKGGAAVQVVMTPAATRFITPLTFQTLTGNPVFSEMFAGRNETWIPHIELLDGVDLLVIAPASANTVAKMATGISDNLLTTLYLAATCPVVVVPSMNVNMFAHQTVIDNLERLRSVGCQVMDPDSGELACGVYGKGRMPEPSDIYSFSQQIFRDQDFKDINVLVTAGPTREPLDPVRYISNPSTGLMGFAIARALQERGALVTLISGPTALKAPPAVNLISVTTAEQMHRTVIDHYDQCRLVIKAAAVSDFKPSLFNRQKVKKNDACLHLELSPTADILMELGRLKKDQVLVGFAAETENVVQNARDKLTRKNLDLIVVNDLAEEGAGFATPTNRVTVIDRSGAVEELPLMKKEELAHSLLDRILPLLNTR